MTLQGLMRASAAVALLVFVAGGIADIVEGQTGTGPTKISQLPVTPTALTGSEIFPCDQASGGIYNGAYGCKLSQIPTYLQAIGFSTGGGGSGSVTLNGDVTGSGTGTIATTLANTSTARSDLGLGNVAVLNAGTSGATVGLLNANKTDSGNNTASGTTTFTGPVFQPRKTITHSGSPYTPAITDYELCGDTTGGTVAFNLPTSPTAGERFLFVDCNGDAATNNLTIVPAAGETIGQSHTSSALTLNVNGASVGVTWDTTNSNWDTH